MNDEIYKYFNIPYMDKDGIIRYASGHVSKRLIESTDDWYRIALQVWRRDIDRFKALEGEIGSAEPVKTVALESKPPCKNLNGLGCPTDCWCTDKE